MNSKYNQYLAILLGSVFLCASCQKTKDGNEPIAKVNGTAISRSAFQAELNRVAGSPTKDFNDAANKKALLEEMIRREVLFQSAMKEDYPERSERLKRLIANEYLRQAVTPESAKPTDAEAEKYFNEHREEFEKVRASHILVKSSMNDDAKKRDAARKKAEGILRRIRAEGANNDFAATARKESEDTASAKRGGDLFFFNRKRMDPKFTEAAFALEKVGDVSNVVETPFGFHIIKLTAKQTDFASLKEAVRGRLMMENQKTQTDRFVDGLRESASVSVNDSMLESVKPPARREKGGFSHPPIQGMGNLPPGH